MRLKERGYLLVRIDQLIRMKFRGNSNMLSDRLGISRSTFFRCLDDMKDLGAPIAYNDHDRCYYYEREGKFLFGFEFKKELGNDEMRSMGGGFMRRLTYLNKPLFNLFQ